MYKIRTAHEEQRRWSVDTPSHQTWMLLYQPGRRARAEFAVLNPKSIHSNEKNTSNIHTLMLKNWTSSSSAKQHR